MEVLSPQDVVCLPPGSIIPVHEPRDPEISTKIERSMWRSGWLGRPLLVVPEGDGIYQALTGSHRLGAAKVVGLSSIPALVLPETAVRKVRASRFFPMAPPLLTEELFGSGENWIARFILLDQWIGDRAKPWANPTLDYLRALGHEDMVDIMSIKKWPCSE
jgi:ParB-like nuclease family protein